MRIDDADIVAAASRLENLWLDEILVQLNRTHDREWNEKQARKAAEERRKPEITRLSRTEAETLFRNWFGAPPPQVVIKKRRPLPVPDRRAA